MMMMMMLMMTIINMISVVQAFEIFHSVTTRPTASYCSHHHHHRSHRNFHPSISSSSTTTTTTTTIMTHHRRFFSPAVKGFYQKVTTNPSTTKLWDTLQNSDSSPTVNDNVNKNYGYDDDDDIENEDEKLVTTIEWSPKGDKDNGKQFNGNGNAAAATTTASTTITLIGTAHLSKRSNAQVRRIIEEIQPTMVMIELDPGRIHRIGFRSMDEMKGQSSTKSTPAIERVIATGDKIPLLDEFFSNDPIHTLTENNGGGPFGIFGLFVKSYLFVQDGVIEIFTQIARAMLTKMYNSMSNELNAGNTNGNDDDEDILIPGGEFLAAIKAAQRCPACHTLILGDNLFTGVRNSRNVV